MQQHWLTWSLLLAIGFPLLMIFLGEITLQLERRKNPLTNLLKILRNLILPCTALFILLFQVLQLPQEGILVRASETLLWIALIYFGLTLINQILFEEAQQDTWRSQVPKLLLDLGRTFLVIVGTGIVLANVWDANVGRLLAALGVGSLILGLALQDSLSNIFSGITLLLEQPIKIGDWIELANVRGQVREITWRSVHLYTFQKHLVIVPNSELAKGSFSNYSGVEPLHGVEVEIKFSRDDPPNKVIEVLKKIALETKGVLQEPPPKVFLTSLDDWFLMYKTVLFVKDYVQGIESKHEFQLRMWYASQRYDLTMPYPIAIEYKSPPPTAKYSEQKALEVLRQAPGWESVAPEFLPSIFAQSTVESYSKKEVIVKEGTPLRGLYIILEGEVALSFQDLSGEPKNIAHLFAGEIFGEKASLLSDQTSEITITALADTQVLIVSIEALHATMLRFPALANKLGETMEIRRRQVGVF